MQGRLAFKPSKETGRKYCYYLSTLPCPEYFTLSQLITYNDKIVEWWLKSIYVLQGNRAPFYFLNNVSSK
jgi:hypothetical protein